MRSKNRTAVLKGPESPELRKETSETTNQQVFDKIDNVLKMFEDLIDTYGLSNVMYDMEHLYPHGYSLLSSWFSP